MLQPGRQCRERWPLYICLSESESESESVSCGGKNGRRRVGKGKVWEERNEKNEGRKRKEECEKAGGILFVGSTTIIYCAYLQTEDGVRERRPLSLKGDEWEGESGKDCCLLIIHSIEFDQSDHEHCTWDGRKHASQQTHAQ